MGTGQSAEHRRSRIRRAGAVPARSGSRFRDDRHGLIDCDLTAANIRRDDRYSASLAQRVAAAKREHLAAVVPHEVFGSRLNLVAFDLDRRHGEPLAELKAPAAGCVMHQ
jgi:hypothetical protein